VLACVADRIKADVAAGRMAALSAVVGPAMGGIIVAYELGRQLGIPALFTERDDSGVMVLRRGFSVEAGASVLLAEDVVTTGKSVLECEAALIGSGVRIAALACIVDRREGGIELAPTIYAAAKVQVASWEAATCELCKSGSTPVKPGSRKIGR
jgi:orotate phosphoribosyltransferase